MAALFLVPFMSMGFWGGMMGGTMMGPLMDCHGWGWGFGWGGMSIGILLFIALVTLIAIGAYYALSGQARAPQPQADRPLEILRERYARGEITEDEFKKMKNTLKP